MKILYLEDDFDLSETVAEFLEDEGFEVSVAYDSSEALELLYSQNFDLLILDIQVPGINGFELLKQLRESNTQTPAIFTTSRNSIDDLSMGYDVGADDYIKKPFLLKELLLRIKALLKREYNSYENIIKINETIYIDINSQQLQIKNNKYEINHKELELLKLLIKNKNQCVTTETIFEAVWGYDKTHSEQSLRTYIKNLRKLLSKEMIVNIKKQGYMLVVR